MINAGLFTSTTCEWATPQGFYEALDAEFGFTLDVCASEVNAKAPEWHDANDLWSALAKEWNGVCWMNPPYGRRIGEWIAKAHASAQNGATVVCLLPSRTDTAWWHDYVMKADEIRFIRGRLHFNEAGPAPFPSAVVVFRAG